MVNKDLDTLSVRFRLSRSILVLTMMLQPFSTAFALPDGAEAVTGFQLEKYLGTWYEIARLDHFFERGLTRVTASYSMRDDGGVRVLNRGYHAKKDKWKEAEGKAYLVEGPDTGRLKVSFFGPFYGAYNIIVLEPENYSYALVVGKNTKNLWILAREPKLDDSVLQNLVNKARQLGFATDELIYPQTPRAVE